VVTKGSWVQTLEMLNGNYACFYFANGDFRGKWERLIEAMGSSTAKGGCIPIHDERWRVIRR